jgi:ribosome-associated protein
VTADRDLPFIELPGGVRIRRDELTFTSSRSGGPGGQNVNKVSTRVTLRFDVDASPSLTEQQKARIRRRLATRVTRDGVLHVVSSKHRTQAANRKAATERFVELFSEALRPRKRRIPTKTPHRSKEQRLAEKARRGETKRLRRRPARDE